MNDGISQEASALEVVDVNIVDIQQESAFIRIQTCNIITQHRHPSIETQSIILPYSRVKSKQINKQITLIMKGPHTEVRMS